MMIVYTLFGEIPLISSRGDYRTFICLQFGKVTAFLRVAYSYNEVLTPRLFAEGSHVSAQR